MIASRRAILLIVVLCGVASSLGFTGFNRRAPTPSHKTCGAISSSEELLFTSSLADRTAHRVMMSGDGREMPSTDPSRSIEDTIDGYEYVHPDIASMLLTRVRQSDHTDGLLPFEVDPYTLTLVSVTSRPRDRLNDSTTNCLPIEMLAGLADECDRVVFGSKTNRTDTPKKLLGLIRLSQLSVRSPEQNEKDLVPIEVVRDEQFDDNGRHPSVLVASMVALNLLESSIRALVLGYRDCAGDNSVPKKSPHIREPDPKGPKGAPLLRDMIEQISDMHGVTLEGASSTRSQRRVISASDLAPILRALLLPTRAGGINLRNLVSHGFLSTIERRWFSVVIVVIQTLDCLRASCIDVIANERVAAADGEDRNPRNGRSIDQEHATSLSNYGLLTSEVQCGKHILLQDGMPHSSLRKMELQASALVPATHLPFLRFSLQVLAPTLVHNIRPDDHRDKPAIESDNTMLEPSLPSLPAIFATTVCCLLEHSLRLKWCHSNSRPDGCFARPSEYYVTLDGHGQRDKHDVMIATYLRDGKTRNQLIPLISAPACALLSDMFTAPSAGAPNIRSALCHGSWDDEIVKELEGLVTANGRSADESPFRSDPRLVDAAFALVSCMDLISTRLAGKEARLSYYRPVYSHAAVAVRSMKRFLHSLAKLDGFIINDAFINDCTRTFESQRPELCSDLRPFRIELQAVEDMARDIFPSLRKADDEVWTVDDAYEEHDINIALAGNIAALALLSDASDAIDNCIAGLDERINSLPMEPKSTKDRRLLKSSSRFCSAAKVTRDLYTWAVYVALVAVRLSLPDDYHGKCVNRDDLVKALERTRMTLSTFDSYLTTNLERSLKALKEYLKGKAVKKILQN